MRTGIIVCTRLDSKRVPNKPMQLINGKPVIAHLHDRLRRLNIPIIYAMPDSTIEGDMAYYKCLRGLPGARRLWYGFDDDPLARMNDAAKAHELDIIIRITHDKIFIDDEALYLGLDQFRRHNLDYLYSSHLTPGTGFEIISARALELAAAAYKKVEHVSYAIRAVTENKLDMHFARKSGARLLIDYPEDVQLMNVLFGVLGNDCQLVDVLGFLNQLKNGWAREINRLPTVSVYTCALNAEKFIDKCMGSVSAQKGFREMEYILVDDHSTDATALKMARFASLYKNVKYIRNGSNLGLASSSNIALAAARGEYIVRMDADDWFSNPTAINTMIEAIEKFNADAVYPANYFGSMKSVQMPNEHHHIGGALFKTRAINHIKFTEGLRGYEGLDFFGRAQSQLKIAYVNKPLFFYTQRHDSMSKTNLAEREELKRRILEQMPK